MSVLCVAAISVDPQLREGLLGGQGLLTGPLGMTAMEQPSWVAAAMQPGLGLFGAYLLAAWSNPCQGLVWGSPGCGLVGVSMAMQPGLDYVFGVHLGVASWLP